MAGSLTPYAHHIINVLKFAKLNSDSTIEFSSFNRNRCLVFLFNFSPSHFVYQQMIASYFRYSEAKQFSCRNCAVATRTKFTRRNGMNVIGQISTQTMCEHLFLSHFFFCPHRALRKVNWS